MNKRYALCVGNNYPGTSAELSGCVNDANDWHDLLVEVGYDEVLTVLEATKAETLGYLKSLVARARFGDRVVFTYSGHGSWIPDRDGDEVDRRDEVLVAADYMQGGLITDDELQEVASGLRYGASLLILSDSCHSGTVNRLLSSTPHNPDRKPRFLSPADLPTVGISVERAVDLEQKLAGASRRTANLVSGCADQEYSYDASFDGRPNGAFSRVAIDTWEPNIALGRWHKKIREHLPNSWYPQTPQLTASRYRKYTRAI